MSTAAALPKDGGESPRKAHHAELQKKRFAPQLSQQPRLVVRVLGARGLAGKDASTAPDPVARVWCARLDAARDETQEAQETPPCRGTTDPAWDDAANEFCFALQLDAPEDVTGGCCVLALHDDRLSRESGFRDGAAALGEVVVPLRDVFAKGRPMAATRTVHLTATWLPLGDGGELLASFVFFFGQTLSKTGFDGAVRRVLGLPELADQTPSRRPHDGGAPVELRGLGSLSPIREADELEFSASARRRRPVFRVIRVAAPQGGRLLRGAAPQGGRLLRVAGRRRL